MSPEFEITDEQRDRYGLKTELAGSRLRLVPRGELDLASAPSLTGRFDQLVADLDGVGSAPEVAVTVDLRGLTFIDCAGMRALVEIRRTCHQVGWSFKLIPGPDHIQQTLEMTRLEEQLDAAQANGAQQGNGAAVSRPGLRIAQSPGA